MNNILIRIMLMLIMLFLLWFIWKIIILVEFLWYYCKNGKLDVQIGKRFSDKLWNCIFYDYSNQFMFVDSDSDINFYESVSFGDTFRR